MTLQSQFMNIKETSAGTDHLKNTLDLGIVTLDSWFVALKGKLTWGTAAPGLQIISVGIETQPTTLPGRWQITGTVNYDHLLKNYLGGTHEGLAAFGSTVKMPLFYLLVSTQILVTDQVQFKKIFRRGLYSADNVTFYTTKDTLEGTEANSALTINAQFKQVISPEKW